MQRFLDKTVIVTGAASGIGQGVAERFAAEGANVVVCDIDEDALKEAARAWAPARTLALRCDVSRFDDVQALVAAAVERFGGLDVMVNNAGIAKDGSVGDVTLDDWQATLDTNLSGVFHGCRAALPHLLEREGCIVNTASVSGLGGDWAMSAYNAAKGGVVNLTRSLALDYGARGVRTNAVCPSLTRTGMTTSMLEDEALVERFMDRLPLRKVAQPADIAGVVAFLASEDARFVNGVNLPVDGGVTASNGQPAM
jgi:meso-butanediol dehydrogenase/(S,S)-butanediol dehydrogenase/diacetyl reductase